MKHLPHALTCGVVEGEKNLGFRSSAQRLVFLSPCFYRLYKKCHHVIITNTTKHKAQPARPPNISFCSQNSRSAGTCTKMRFKKNSLDVWGISSLRLFSFVLIQFAQHTIFNLKLVNRPSRRVGLQIEISRVEYKVGKESHNTKAL